LFGKHLEAAEATVLFVELPTHGHYEFILEVCTQAGQTFRTTVRDSFVPLLEPAVGDMVKVQYDPKSQQVKLDTKGDIRYDQHAKDRARKAEHDAILVAPAGTPLLRRMAQAHQIADPELISLVQLELAQRNELRDDLVRSGSEGIGTILNVHETGLALSSLACYLVGVQVSPIYGGSSFHRPVEVWIDPRQGTVAPGDAVRVRYDPQDTSRIVLQFSWE
jgi:hypothetical protein